MNGDEMGLVPYGTVFDGPPLVPFSSPPPTLIESPDAAHLMSTLFNPISIINQETHVMHVDSQRIPSLEAEISRLQELCRTNYGKYGALKKEFEKMSEVLKEVKETTEDLAFPLSETQWWRDDGEETKKLNKILLKYTRNIQYVLQLPILIDPVEQFGETGVKVETALPLIHSFSSPSSLSQNSTKNISSTPCSNMLYKCSTCSASSFTNLHEFLAHTSVCTVGNLKRKREEEDNEEGGGGGKILPKLLKKERNEEGERSTKDSGLSSDDLGAFEIEDNLHEQANNGGLGGIGSFLEDANSECGEENSGGMKKAKASLSDIKCQF